LPEEIEVSMNDLDGLAGIANGFLQAFGKSEVFVYRLEQNGASIRAAVRLIKGNGNGSVKMCSEKYRLCGRLESSKSLFCGMQLDWSQVVIRTKGLFVLSLHE
jgi:hypothetical protein